MSLIELSRKEREEYLGLLIEKELRIERRRYEGSLIEFVRAGWKYIDPNKYVHGWHLEAIAEHLEAVVAGDIRNLLINVPPRTSKSSIVSAAFPAWTWAQRDIAPLAGPQVQFLHRSYAGSLSIRDSIKTRRLIESPWYQERWGDRFSITSDQNTKIRFDNDKGGYRLATSVGGALTGEGGSIIVVDDPHNAVEMESDLVRQSTIDWWDNSLSTRLNDPKTGAYVVIMQRLHKEDLSGHILSTLDNCCHLMLPMRYEEDRRCTTVTGWADPRHEEGELLCPERFGETEVTALEERLGPFGAAGQLQQRPTPKGGGILKEEWWMRWDEESSAHHGVNSGAFPPMELIVASLDGAYTEKQENDPSAMTVWGLWRDRHENPMLMLMNAWAKRLEIHGAQEFATTMRLANESDAEFRQRQSHWGLTEWVIFTCNKFKADRLLIESKATGISVYQEIRRLQKLCDWSTSLIDPGRQDKVARAYAVQPHFANGQVFAPDRAWADQVISQCASFPKASHDDLVDTVTQSLRWFREAGLLRRPSEIAAEQAEENMHKSRVRPIYDV